MKHFWTLPAVLRLALLVAAEQRPFSIHDDLLAYPQYDIHFSDDYVLEELALSKLRRSRPRIQTPETPMDSSASHIERYNPPAHTDSSRPEEHYYEELVLRKHRYLCAIPEVQIEDPDTNGNNTESKAELEKELSEANARGWALLMPMDCIYYNEGWWTYSYCHGSGVRQFHMLATQGPRTWPPIEDPNTHGYNLGIAQKNEGAEGDVAAKTQDELGVKGGTRYLVRKLQDGDECDLTFLKRTVEVQIHCNKDLSMDAITQVQELSTCAYLIIIETPRLCKDVAFQPQLQEKPHNITCQRILLPADVKNYEQELEQERVQKISGDETEQIEAHLAGKQFVGDIIVNGRQFLPKSVTLEKGALLGGKEKLVATIATSEGMQMKPAQMKEFKLDVKDVEKWKKKIAQLAQEKGGGWSLDLVDTPNGREYRGVLVKKEGEDIKDDKAGSKKADEAGEGSEEEYFKEEL